MNNSFKIVVLVVVVLYIISPVDLAVGPIDDLIVALLGFAVNQASKKKADKEEAVCGKQ